jgi:hypothetical protein
MPGPVYRATVSVVASNPEWITKAGGPNDGLTDGEDDDTAAFPFDLPYTTDDWSQSVARVTNLWHLEGRLVSILGDGIPLGTATVSGGAIDLPLPAVIVVVGIPITAEITTLETDSTDAETTIDKSKAVCQITLRTDRTLGIRVGLYGGRRQAFEPGWCRPGTYQEGALFTGVCAVYAEGQVDDLGRVSVRQTQPLPASILGAYPRMTIGEAT